MGGNDTTTTYTCGNAGRMIRERLTDGTAKGYNYDSNGNRTRFTLTKNNVQQISWTGYSYNAGGMMTGLATQNGTA